MFNLDFQDNYFLFPSCRSLEGLCQLWNWYSFDLAVQWVPGVNSMFKYKAPPKTPCSQTHPFSILVWSQCSLQQAALQKSWTATQAWIAELSPELWAQLWWQEPHPPCKLAASNSYRSGKGICIFHWQLISYIARDIILGSYLNYQNGEENKTGFLLPNDMTEASLEQYDYRLNRNSSFSVLANSFHRHKISTDLWWTHQILSSKDCIDLPSSST